MNASLKLSIREYSIERKCSIYAWAITLLFNYYLLFCLNLSMVGVTKLLHRTLCSSHWLFAVFYLAVSLLE
jgi:hypothetical protein